MIAPSFSLTRFSLSGFSLILGVAKMRQGFCVPRAFFQGPLLLTHCFRP